MPAQMNKRSKEQIEKFREAARDLETDDSEERFDKTLKSIAGSSSKAPPAKGEAKKN